MYLGKWIRGICLPKSTSRRGRSIVPAPMATTRSDPFGTNVVL